MGDTEYCQGILDPFARSTRSVDSGSHRYCLAFYPCSLVRQKRKNLNLYIRFLLRRFWASDDSLDGFLQLRQRQKSGSVVGMCIPSISPQKGVCFRSGRVAIFTENRLFEAKGSTRPFPPTRKVWGIRIREFAFFRVRQRPALPDPEKCLSERTGYPRPFSPVVEWT